MLLFFLNLYEKKVWNRENFEYKEENNRIK